MSWYCRALILCGVALSSVAVRADALVTDLSKDRVSIQANFSGDRILIFGALVPSPHGATRHIVATIEGPPHNVMLRRKERVGGVWVNRQSLALHDVPSYYAVVSSAPLAEIASPALLRANGIGAKNFINQKHIAPTPSNERAFLRLKQAQRLYTDAPVQLNITGGRLFRTEIDLPSGITTGAYRVRYFLFEDGRIIDRHSDNFHVSVVGLQQFLYSMAHHRPLIYGLMGVALACMMGWGAARLTRI